MPQRIRKGDMVAVVSGADKGKRGRVLRIVKEKDRVIVEGVNLVFKHLRKSQQYPQGGRIRREAALHLSNVMPIDSETNLPTRVASKANPSNTKDGNNVRVGIRSGAAVGISPKKPASKAGKKES